MLRNRRICRNLRLFCYVAGKNLLDFSTQLCKAGAVRCSNTAMRIGWNVQQQAGIRTDGIQIDVQQFACRAHVSVLLRVVKPTCSDGSIHLGRIPDKFSCIADNRSAADVLALRVNFAGEFSVIRLLRFRCRAFCIPQLCGNHAPLGFPAMPGLVAAPAHIGTADIQNRIRLQFAQYCIVAFPIVNLLFAVFALATGTVKPEAENISVVCCKLSQLGNEIIIIRFPLPIACIVTIPRGEIDTKLDTAAPAGIRYLAHNIALSVLPRAVFYAVLGVGARPQAEAVMVLAGQNQRLHAGTFDCGDPLVGIQRIGVEQRRGFGAVAPLAVREGIHAEMGKGVKFKLLPCQLARAGRDRGRIADLFFGCSHSITPQCCTT